MKLKKKAQVLLPNWMAFFVAIVFIILIYAIVSSTFGYGFGIGRPDPATINLKVDTATKSSVCNYDLMNFLRMKDSSGLTFAELLAYDRDFDIPAKEFFNKNYERGDKERENWRLEVLTTSYEPVTVIGDLIETEDTCQQVIPKNNGDNLIVRLGVEY